MTVTILGKLGIRARDKKGNSTRHSLFSPRRKADLVLLSAPLRSEREVLADESLMGPTMVFGTRRWWLSSDQQLQ